MYKKCKLRDIPVGGVFSRCASGYKYIKTNKTEQCAAGKRPICTCLENGSYYAWDYDDKVMYWPNILATITSQETADTRQQRFWLVAALSMIEKYGQQFDNWNDAHDRAKRHAENNTGDVFFILEATHTVSARLPKEKWITTEQTIATKCP